MRYLALLGMMGMPGLVFADCLEFAAPGVPRYLRQAVAYHLAYEAGHNVVPHAPDGLQVGQSMLDGICYDGVTPAQIQTFLSDQTMLDRHTQEEQARQAAANALVLIEQDLATLDAQLAADDTAWDSLTTAQKLAVMKKRLRADVLRQRLGR